MNLSRRHFLAAPALLAAPSLLAHSSLLAPAWADTVTLRVANYKAGDPLLLRLAGLGDTPYRIAWSEFGSGNVMIEAINAGAIDLAYGSEIPPIFAAVSGARVKVIAVIKGDVNEQVVLVPKDSPIRSIADLRGKRVGYVKATTTHYYLLRMLEEAGLGFGDIVPVNLTPSDGQAAFRSGALDAWAIYGYSVPLARDTGARVLKTALGYLSGNYLTYAAPDALADAGRRAAIADLLGRIAQAYRWIDDHHAEYAAAQSAVLGVPEAAIRSLLDAVSQPRRLVPADDAAIASEQQVADTFARAGVLPRAVDVAPLWDRGFAADLAPRLADRT
ncbi:MAG TPA: ABC transporter substrate-binding protein [Stellaceae bacterium]|nr:ABC transporter substrate-binding protein [Stellaceae bacterium]